MVKVIGSEWLRRFPVRCHQSSATGTSY